MVASSLFDIIFDYNFDMSKIINVFSERLKELRSERGLSIKQLAKELLISDMAISRWERKLQVPNIEMLDLLARYFKTTPNYLLGYED